MEPYLPQRLTTVANLCTSVVFGLTVTAVLQNPNFTCVERDLACAELYSGPFGRIAAAAAAAGRSAAVYDKLFDSSAPAHTTDIESHGGDILTHKGFHIALQLVMRLAPGGLLFAAPDCSSFCWLAQSVMCRKAANKFAGATSHPKVDAGNRIALATAFLLTVAWCRGVTVAMENPPRSYIFNFLRSCSMLPFMHSSAVRDRCLDDESKSPLKKDYKVVASEDWTGLAGRCMCPPIAQHVKLTHVRQTGGKTKRTGKAGPMKASASYLPRFGELVVAMWLRTPPPQPPLRLRRHTHRGGLQPDTRRRRCKHRLNKKNDAGIAGRAALPRKRCQPSRSACQVVCESSPSPVASPSEVE